MKNSHRLRFIAALIITAALLGCGGGASSVTALPPVGTQSGSGSTATQNYTLTGNAQTLALPAVNGCTGKVTLPFSSGAAASALSLTTSLSAPAGILFPSSLRTQTAGRINFLCYVTLNVASTVTFTTLPGFTVTVASAISTAAPQQFFYAISDPTVTNIARSFRTEGPATVSGQTLTFAPAPDDALTLQAHTNYIFAFYGTTTPTSNGAKLYVTNAGGDSVSVFDTTRGNAFLYQITGGGLSGPRGVAVDTSGKLYVANGVTDSISVFDTTRNNAVLPSITGGNLNNPQGMTIDESGKLYVVDAPGCDICAGFSGVSIFDTHNGNAALPPIAVGNNAFVPQGVAVDANGKLYVSVNGETHYQPQLASVSILDTKNGNAQVGGLIGGVYFGVGDVAVDGSGKLYVAGLFGKSVSVYDTAHGNAAVATITGSSLVNPVGVAVDARGRLYVANAVCGPYCGSPTGVSIFDTAHGNAELTPITDGGLDYPTGVAVH